MKNAEIYSTVRRNAHIILLLLLLCMGGTGVYAQSQYDTIRLGGVSDGNSIYPMVFLPESQHTAAYLDPEERVRRNRLRRDVFVAYPYAITAATILHNVDSTMDALDRRRDRRRYLREVDRQLDVAFKKPLKNLTISQGNVLVKLINRQTGKNCYSIIRELKSGFAAVVWQSVGVMFDNNLRRDYDPQGEDRELEQMVVALEASANYRYLLHLQNEMMKKVPTTASR